MTTGQAAWRRCAVTRFSQCRVYLIDSYVLSDNSANAVQDAKAEDNADSDDYSL